MAQRSGDSDEMLDWLGRRETYPGPPPNVELRETHISWVFLTDQFVYKLKKPVEFDFLDYSTVDKRRWSCREELRLNRRLAPDVYLDVVRIVRDSESKLRLGGAGETVDWAVKMRRLPDDQSLAAQIRERELPAAQLDAIAGVLATFYESLVPVEVDAASYVGRLNDHVRQNREALLECDRLPSNSVRRIHGAQLQSLRLQPELFARRTGDGGSSRIVEGHGDLRPEHVYLTPQPIAIDCIEFNREFRELDVADELSFLAMECDALAAAEVGRCILDRCCQMLDDQPPAVLIAFYKSYRACVRAKVKALRSEQLEAGAAAKAINDAEKYLCLADQYSRLLGDPILIVVRGLMGTGKSTVARGLSDALGAELLQTDHIRQQLFGPNRDDAAYGEGRYRDENRQRVYDQMLMLADKRLTDRLSVVLDGSFLSAALCRQAAALAVRNQTVRNNVRLLFVQCECPDVVARERIARRAAQGSDASEARPELYHQQQQDAEPIPADLPRCKVDTNAYPDEIVERVIREFQRP